MLNIAQYLSLQQNLFDRKLQNSINQSTIGQTHGKWIFFWKKTFNESFNRQLIQKSQ